MRWLLHGNLSPAVVDALLRHEQEVRRSLDIGLPAEAPAKEVLEAARKAQLEILTSDPVLAHWPFEQPTRFVRVMVLLGVEPAGLEQSDAIDRLFERYKRLSPGRLYTVTAARVKVRQLPGAR